MIYKTVCYGAILCLLLAFLAIQEGNRTPQVQTAIQYPDIAFDATLESLREKMAGTKRPGTCKTRGIGLKLKGWNK